MRYENKVAVVTGAAGGRLRRGDRHDHAASDVMWVTGVGEQMC